MFKSRSASGNGRTFSYSSVGRLTDATNPESGLIGYTYDANGNVQTRVSGGITTTYTYDGVDQVTGKSRSRQYQLLPPTAGRPGGILPFAVV